MLTIKRLFKEHGNSRINDIEIELPKGSSVHIECSGETSDLLIHLILGEEVLARGEILIGNMNCQEYIKKHPGKIGVIAREDFYYERMTIEGYMKFFAEVAGTGVDIRKMLMKLALLDIAETQIKELNFSQKRRLSLARERLKQPELLLFQEPILNMDRDGTRIIMENIIEMQAEGTAVLITSVLLRDTLMIGERAFLMGPDGLEELCSKEDSAFSVRQEESSIDNEQPEFVPVIRIEKIPAKLEERILLFDPMEIDFIESEQGVSNLNIKGEKFPCTLSLSELEDRLKHFGFFRCHRSYLVNLQKVKEVVTWTRNSYSLSIDDKVGSTVPLSKGRMDELKDILKL